jgi:predicted RNA-binding protein with PUA-like domain
VRGFAARNYMMEMQIGDHVLFYHSSCPVPGVYGLAKVSHLAEPDKAQFDPKSKYYDARSKKEKPWWYGVRVRYVKTFQHPVTLEEIKKDPKLRDMKILQESRLSVSPVTKSEFDHIVKIATV